MSRSEDETGVWKGALYNEQIETKNKHRTLLFTAYIEVRFLNLQHKIQHTDTSVFSFKTDNLLKTIGKLISFSDQSNQK